MLAPDIPHRLRTRLLLLPALPIALWAVVVVLTVVQGEEMAITFEEYAHQNMAVYREVHEMYSALTEKHLKISSMIELSRKSEQPPNAEVFYQNLIAQIDSLDAIVTGLSVKHEQMAFAQEIAVQHARVEESLASYRLQLVKTIRSASVDINTASLSMADANAIFVLLSQRFSIYLGQIDTQSLYGFEKLKEASADKNSTIATVATATAILVLILCISLYRRLSGGFQQMLSLASAMQGRGLKNYHYYFSDDEMGYLAKRIYHLGTALDDMRNNLEDRVDRRTQELQKVTVDLVKEVKKSNEMASKLRVLADTDELTGLYNRRFFMSQLDKEWRRGERYKRCLVLLLVDVDYFKQVNDQYGHQAGDECLRIIANTIKDNVQRSSDLVSRFGGEEFTIILPETSLEEAQHIADNLLTQVKKQNRNQNQI
jgi:diguanylate cyclase (GGDEF)-like protein